MSSCSYTQELKKSEETCSQGFVDELVEALRGEEGCDEDTIRASWKAICADAPLVGKLDQAARTDAIELSLPTISVPTGLIKEILSAFDFELPESENTWTGVVRAKIIDTNIALLNSVVDNIAEAIEAQAKRFMRIVRLMSKLGATVTGTTQSWMYSVTNTAFDAADRFVELISNRRGWVVRAVAGIGICMYMWQACVGDASESSWVSCYTSAIDWISGIFNRLLGSVPVVGSTIYTLVNFALGNQIVVIKLAFGKLQLQLARLTALCRGAQSEDAQSEDAPKNVEPSKPTPSTDYDTIQSKIDASFAEAFGPTPS